MPVDNFTEHFARMSANDGDDLEDEYGVRGRVMYMYVYMYTCLLMTQVHENSDHGHCTDSFELP